MGRMARGLTLPPVTTDSLLKEGMAAELSDAEDGRILRDHLVHKRGPDSYDDILFL